MCGVKSVDGDLQRLHWSVTVKRATLLIYWLNYIPTNHLWLWVVTEIRMCQTAESRYTSTLEQAVKWVVQLLNRILLRRLPPEVFLEPREETQGSLSWLKNAFVPSQQGCRRRPVKFLSSHRRKWKMLQEEKAFLLSLLISDKKMTSYSCRQKNKTKQRQLSSVSLTSLFPLQNCKGLSEFCSWKAPCK